MSRIAPGQIAVVRVETPGGTQEISLAFGLPKELDDAVARIRLEAAIDKHDSHNEKASPKRYGKARCMDCKKSIVRWGANECRKCGKYVCPDCRLGMHDFTHHTLRAVL